MRWRRARPVPAPAGPARTTVERALLTAFFIPITPRCNVRARTVPDGVVIEVSSRAETSAAAEMELKNAVVVLAHYTREALGELE